MREDATVSDRKVYTDCPVCRGTGWQPLRVSGDCIRWPCQRCIKREQIEAHTSRVEEPSAMSERDNVIDFTEPDDDDHDFYADLVEDDDPFEAFDCAMDEHGNCGKAGSEECDWECPFNRLRGLRN